MTVEDDRDNSPLEEQIFGVILLLPLLPVLFDTCRPLSKLSNPSVSLERSLQVLPKLVDRRNQRMLME
jgi:hypothetical protein